MVHVLAMQLSNQFNSKTFPTFARFEAKPMVTDSKKIWFVSVMGPSWK